MTTGNRTDYQKQTLTQQDIAVLNSTFENRGVDEILKWGYEEFGNSIVLGTGFGPSGVVLIHHITELGLPIKVFCLDTNLLFKETYTLWKTIEKHFDIKIEAVKPIVTLEGQETIYEHELWKSDPDMCCHLRKVLPLRKYLSNKNAWITGLRRSQSVSRQDIDKIEWDQANKVCKINPLAEWNQDEVWWTINRYDLPYNPMHDDGFPSIGCIPCTTKADSPDDERSGRWKNLDKTECGIHFPGISDQDL